MKSIIKSVGFWSSIVAAVTSVGLFLYIKNKECRPAPSEVKSYLENSEVELLAITPEGTKVYKIRAEKLIVPIIIVQTSDGHVSIR